MTSVVLIESLIAFESTLCQGADYHLAQHVQMPLSLAFELQILASRSLALVFQDRIPRPVM